MAISARCLPIKDRGTRRAARPLARMVVPIHFVSTEDMHAAAAVGKGKRVVASRVRRRQDGRWFRNRPVPPRRQTQTSLGQRDSLANRQGAIAGLGETGPYENPALAEWMAAALDRGGEK